MKETLRAGLVGVGSMGRNHARILASLDGVELVAVADPAGGATRLGPGVRQVRNVAELIAVGLDIAVVACPTALHHEVGLALAAAGVHTLIEKPLAVGVDECAELVTAFESRGLVNAVGHIERYNPALRALRARLDAGELGEVYQVASRRQGPFPSRISDVGVVRDLATHDIDLTAWVLRSQYESVAAQTAHKSGRAHEDLVAITARTTSGITINHLVNWLSPLKERVTVVSGDRGTFVADTLQGDLTFHENGTVATEWDRVSSFRGVSEGNSTRYAIPKREPLLVEHEQFRDRVLGRDAEIVTMREGMRTVLVADACLLSANEGRTVMIPGD